MITLLLTLSFPVIDVPFFQQSTVKEDISAFKKIISGRHKEDEAIVFIDGFIKVFENHKNRLVEIEDSLEIGEGKPSDLKKERTLIEREQDSLAKAVWKSFSRKNVTGENKKLWTAAVYAFGQMGDFGPPYLWKAFEDKRFRKDLGFQALCVEQIGFTEDYSQADDLVDLLDYKDAVIAAKAADSLGRFRGASVSVRKDAVKTLVKHLEAFRSSAEGDSETDQMFYRIIRGPFTRALTELTGQAIKSSLDWTKWWNNNKNKASSWVQ